MTSNVWSVILLNSLFLRQTLFNNYWTRLSKMSWFVSGEQIDSLPKPQAEANNWSARSTIELNNCFIIRWPRLVFNEYLREGKRSAIPVKKKKRRRKVWFHLRMSRILFPAKHSRRPLCMSRLLLADCYLLVTWWALGQWKGRNISIEW